MMMVLAALDASTAARPVLETALAIGQLTGAEVQAVHVADRAAATPQSLAARAEIPLRLLDGPVESGLLEALSSTDVIAAAMGARATRGGRRPTGRHTRAILEQARKPIIVVPPEAVSISPPRFRRVLVPLDGTRLTSRPVLDVLLPMLAQQVEFVVLHIFTEETMPRVLDRPGRDLEMWGAEFLARYCPSAVDIELRVGSVAGEVADLCRDRPVDLVVLSWAQDSSGGRATVIRQVLADTSVPVMVLPTNAVLIDSSSSRSISTDRAESHHKPLPKPRRKSRTMVTAGADFGP